MKMDWETLATTPARMAPPGVTSDLIHPASRSWNVQLTIGITLAPAILLVALRIYARLRLARSLGADDYVCLFATITTIVFNGLVLSLLDRPGGGALGPHIWNVSLLRIYEYQWPAVVESVFLRISNTLIKVSLLTFYLRLFNPVPRLKVMIWVGLVAVVAFLFAFLIGALVLCRPLPGEHRTTASLIIPQRCFNELPHLTTAGTIFSVASDFYILFIPIHLLPSLKLSRKRKAAVAGVFFIGFFACLAGVTNLTIRFVRYPPSVVNDFTWGIIDTYISK
ncbi:putative integral membrane protein [Rosellinia necatrix]|uniref:Putative integral membrane protein n=1 Tax=Rosellinia necatrix TaxID=77044 RepID=A0A1S7UNG6_ROSNE|nr:putative integral membrane protein [Rosellinia necatrix]